MAEEPVPREKVEEMAKQVRHLLALKDRQKATIAEMIRACLFWIRIDPQHYRLRGHETFGERQQIIADNKQNKARALLHLEELATMLEDSIPSGNLTQSAEGEPPCISE